MSRQKGDIMRDVLVSIQPKWCELIASGKKTVEVRKTKPKIETPFKCYIYCTKDNTFAEKTLRGFDDNGKAIYYKANKGKVIGEFVCDAIFPISCYYSDTNARFIHSEQPFTCLTDKQMIDYLGNGVEGYGWHISDLVVYDEPRELCEFFQVKAIRGYHKKDEPKTDGINIPRLLNSTRFEVNFLTRPPQSWCYIETRQTAD